VAGETPVHSALWILVGILIGSIGMAPVMRAIRRRAESRAREAEGRARQSERLAELGAMTGGLAHEIKNPLSTIGLNAQLLSEGLAESELPEAQRDRLLRRLSSLAREVERLRGILTDFLQFAGRMKLDPHRHDLRVLVDELSDFFHPQCDQAGVLLRTQVPDAPVFVDVDASLLKQALLNLMINATQAMTDENGAALPSPPPATQGELILRVEASDGEARVHVTDTGPGLEPDRLEQIFHPYVSGKASGTGLGLPTARRIVEEHEGRLTGHSEPGRGCDFVIHVPLSER
jgi:signal transduction histidine kinase